MSSSSLQTPIGHRRSGLRGVSTVEYALILAAVILVGAGSYKLLGNALGKRGSVAGDAVAGGGGSGGSGAGGSNAKASGVGGMGGGGGGAAGKSAVGAKMSVSGVGGAAGESGGTGDGARTGVAGGGAPSTAAAVSTPGSAASGEIAEGFTTKRWFAFGLLFAGLVGLGYVLFSVRRAKNAAAAAAPGTRRAR